MRYILPTLVLMLDMLFTLTVTVFIVAPLIIAVWMYYEFKPKRKVITRPADYDEVWFDCGN